MKSAPPNQLRKSAIDAAHAAGAVLKKYFRKPLQVREKLGAGLVSNADLEAEETTIKILRRKFPNFGFLAEESDPVVSQSPGRWIIDPLDGTNNYVHGFPMFCVSIAAEWKGQIEVGVIYHPIFNDLYVATRGKGATLNGKPISVSNTKLLKSALLTTGFTYKRQDSLHQEMTALEKLSATALGIRRPGSAALDLAYTACGVFDGFWEQQLSPWDVAAGMLLVKEAGGKVTNFSGGKFTLTTPQILATNGKLHKAISEQLV